jgi:hypothetical protein
MNLIALEIESKTEEIDPNSSEIGTKTYEIAPIACVINGMA